MQDGRAEEQVKHRRVRQVPRRAAAEDRPLARKRESRGRSHAPRKGDRGATGPLPRVQQRDGLKGRILQELPPGLTRGPADKMAVVLLPSGLRLLHLPHLPQAILAAHPTRHPPLLHHPNPLLRRLEVLEAASRRR